MGYYFRAGGYTTIVLVVLGLVLLVTAAQFIRQATPRRLAFMRALSLAYVLFTFGVIATNTTVVLWAVVRAHQPGQPYDLDMLMQGLGEAITPAGIGLTLLGIVWVMIAVGVRRAHDTEA